MTPALQAILFGSSSFYPGASLALDFLAQKYRAPGVTTFTPDFSSLPNLTVTRATPSVAYGTTSGGVLVPFAANVARITDQGLLVEEARTNVAQQCQTLDNAYWDVKSSLSVTANATTAPDGTATADKLVEAAATAEHTFGRGNIPASASVPYTVSVYAKAAERSKFRFGPVFGLNNVQFFVDLVAGTVTNKTGGTASTTTITALANGWWRVTVTDTSTTTEVDPAFSLVSTGTTTNYAGDGTSGLYFWNVQVEAGAFVTSPIPTTSASVTRAADSVSIGGMSVPAAYTLFAEEGPRASGSSSQQAPMGLLDGTNSNTANFVFRNAASNFTVNVNSGGVAQYSPVDQGTETGAATIQKMALSLTTNLGKFAANGSVVTTDTSITMPVAPTILKLGDVLGSSYLNGYLRKALIYPTAYADAALQALTT